VVLPNYPRLSRFAGAEPLPRLAADPRLKLIYVGSLSRNRGCALMLEVMERLSPDDAVLYLGGTFASPDMEAEARERLAAGLADRVELLGRVPPAELPAYLAASDVVWVPSVPSTQYAHPTVPTKLFEGMAVGIAALVTDLPGRGELVRAEGCGIAVPAGLDGHLGGVRRLLAERDALGEMGARGREAVARKYSWERAEGALIDFYDTLCRDLPGPRG
jgi:glycosyltransferase involved in cell wall biosynthesis